MEARLHVYDNALAAKFTKYINSAGAVIAQSTLPRATQELVKIRASQINGCAFCTDMHTKDAAHAGKRNYGSTWSRSGGRRPSSPRPSEPPSNSPSRAPGWPMHRAV